MNDPDRTSRLRRHVDALSTPRNRLRHPDAIAAAERYVVSALHAAGWPVECLPCGGAGGTPQGVNVVARHPNPSGRRRLLMLAHYDSVPGSPGADDNASGVAVLLELAEALTGTPDAYGVVLAAVDLEEDGVLGSADLTTRLVADERLAGSLVLECVGYYDGRPGSQRLPRGGALVFPGLYVRLRGERFRGEHLVLVHRADSADLARTLSAALDENGRHTRGPVTLRDPAELPVIGAALRRLAATRNLLRSDHRHLWAAGVPAVLVTDTAEYRNPNYHGLADTPDTLDYAAMAWLVAALVRTVQVQNRST